MRHKALILGCLRRERDYCQDAIFRLEMETTRPGVYTNPNRRKLAEAELKDWRERSQQCKEALQDIRELPDAT